MSELVVEFAGEEKRVGSRLTFGRIADLELDTNGHLHRVAGEFIHEGGHWWLVNRGTRLFLRLVTSTGTRLDMAPSARHALPPGHGVVSLRVGGSLFEINYSLSPQAVARSLQAESPVGKSTLPFDAVLTPREVDFLITFARPLLEGKVEQLPSYAEVAKLWDVSRKTLDNTIQTLRRKLRNARLVRDEPLDELVRVAVAHSLVTRADLEWAAFDGGQPRKAALGPRFGQE
jgi:hypothetical protein